MDHISNGEASLQYSLPRRRLPSTAHQQMLHRPAGGQEHVLDPDLRTTPDSGGEGQRPAKVLGNIEVLTGVFCFGGAFGSFDRAQRWQSRGACWSIKNHTNSSRAEDLGFVSAPVSCRVRGSAGGFGRHHHIEPRPRHVLISDKIPQPRHSQRVLLIRVPV